MAEQAAGLSAGRAVPGAAGPGAGNELRRLFDAVCDLPPAQWRDALQRLGGDAAVVAEVLALLEAQTISFNRALQPLGELMASLPDAELRIGDRLGTWQLVECLAAGGMGTVFVAERADQLFRQRVAIKLLRGIAGDPGIAQRLAEERQILAELQHPNIARLFDGGTTPAGHPYLVMEYIDGLPLDRHCRQHRLGLRARLDMVLRVCRAVQAAHQRLVVHCDLKPSNILVRDQVAPVLLDFGIAQVLGKGGGGDPQAFCTPGYASPEQLAGGRVGMASDVFSLGVLLVELLADRRADRTAVDHDRPVPAPSALAGAGCAWRGALRGDLDAIAARACALEPERRYPSVEALVRDIERHLAHRPVAARAPTVRYLSGRWLRRHWRGAVASVALVLLTGGFVWRLVQERARAEHEAVVAGQVSDFLAATFDAADPRLLGARGTDQVTARQLLDAGAARIGEEDIDDPAVLARLRYVIGRSYFNLGQSERAETLLEQSVEGFLARGVDRPDQAVLALNDLVALLANQRRGAEAVAVARRSLSLAQQLEDPAAIASGHGALGAALRVEGRFDDAQRELETALRMRRALFGERAGKTNDVRHNLALLYQERGEPARAERALREVIGHLPPRSWDYQLSLASLASAIRRQGRYAEAAALLRDNLGLARELYGEHSDRFAKANADLATAYRDAGDYLPAQRHYRAAVDISRRASGEDSAGFAIRLNGLASIEEARGDLAAAERTYRQSLAIRRQLFPPGDNSVLIVEANLGHVLAEMGRLDEARPLLLHALQRWRDLDHPNAVPGALNWIEWLLRAGRLDAAATELAAIPEPARHKAANAEQYLAATASLATRRGAAREAAAHWERLVAVSTGQAGADSVPTAKWRVPYAQALQAAGRPEDARAELDRAEPLLRRALVPGARLLGDIDALRRSLSAGSRPG